MPTRAGRRRALPLLAAIALLAGAGCGSEATPVRGGDTVELAFDEFSLTPRELTGEAGTFTFAARNDGTQVHQLNVREDEGGSSRPRGELRGATSPIRPGDRAELELELPAGRWRLFCSLPRHETLGTWATLELE